MASKKDIKNHLAGIRDTRKITNAMYLIASTKLRKAKAELDSTRPYFDALQAEIKRVFRTSATVESRYFYPMSGEHDLGGSYGYLVITADKGLAGTYNQNVLKEATRLMQTHDDPKLFVVGEYGRHYFKAHGIPIEKSFLYTAQNPTVHRAREIESFILDLFDAGKLSKIFVIYTDMRGAADTQVKSTRLLPFHRAQFIVPDSHEKAVRTPFEFIPSLEKVLDSIVPSYVTGYIYSALISSFCSEQSARMSAMDLANGNAEELMDELSVQYNHIRQSEITQEITEVSSGARSLRRGSSFAHGTVR